MYNNNNEDDEEEKIFNQKRINKIQLSRNNNTCSYCRHMWYRHLCRAALQRRECVFIFHRQRSKNEEEEEEDNRKKKKKKLNVYTK